MTIASHSGATNSLELHVEYFFTLIENYSITVPWKDICLPENLLFNVSCK